MSPQLPESVRMLFWDVVPETVDPSVHTDYILERVMARGRWEAMRWLRATYDVATIADFLARKGDRLAPRERAYWSLVANVEREDEPGGGTPTWANE